MNTKRYGSVAAFFRYLAALLSLLAFLFLFGKLLVTGRNIEIRFADLFFNVEGNLTIPHVYGFVAQVLILLAGAFGVVLVFVDALQDNIKKLSFITGGVLVFCGIIVLMLSILFCAIEGVEDFGNYLLHGTVIASGCMAIVAGGLNIAAPFIKE